MVPLAVSGGFHSPFMDGAAEAFAKELAEIDFRSGKIPVYANLTAKPYADGAAKSLLAQQMNHPVHWEQTLRNMAADGFDTFIGRARQNAQRPCSQDVAGNWDLSCRRRRNFENNSKGGVERMTLQGKTGLITGASRGIGRAIALAFAREGANVAVIYAGSQQAAQHVCAQAAEYGVQARAYQCDVADFDQVKETVQAVQKDLGSVDILVNNAGITRDGLVYTMKEADFDAVLDTNLKGAFHLISIATRFL